MNSVIFMSGWALIEYIFFLDEYFAIEYDSMINRVTSILFQIKVSLWMGLVFW